jgi:hypothetical protein
MTTLAMLPRYRARLWEIAAAEAGEGWLCACAEAGRFLLPSRQLVASLAELLCRLRQPPDNSSPLAPREESSSRRSVTSTLGDTGIVPVSADHPPDASAAWTVLEVCAGRGELAGALSAAGVPVVAADADPPPGSPVVRATAAAALRRWRPAVVLGCFVPVDAGVDDAVLACPSVRHYVVLGARLGGCLGSPALWQNLHWAAEPLPGISRWMLTRHDVWLGAREKAILRHGEAWHFRLRSRGNH